MLDDIFGVIENGKCPNCKKKKVVCIVQYPLIVNLDMKARPIFKDTNGKRKKPSQRDMANMFKKALRSGECQCANYICESCGWMSETYIP